MAPVLRTGSLQCSLSGLLGLGFRVKACCSSLGATPVLRSKAYALMELKD